MAPGTDQAQESENGVSKSANNHPTPLDPDIACWVAGLDDDAREFFEERAGIREFEGGLTRRDAEAEAKDDVVRWLQTRG